MEKFIYHSLIKRLTPLYNEINDEMHEFDVVCQKVALQKKGEHIVYVDDKEVDDVLKKLQASIGSLLCKVNSSVSEAQSIEFKYDISNCLIYICDMYTSNLLPSVLSKQIQITLERLDYLLSVWKLKSVFVTCVQLCGSKDPKAKNMLLDCIDKADKIVPILKK